MAWLRWDAIRRTVHDVAPRTILEVGAGEGAVGSRLSACAQYIGVEPDPRSSGVARSRIEPAGRLITGSTGDLEANTRVDLLCAFEVLEHLEDDRGALGEWRSLLTPDGVLLLSVPAHPERFGPSDRLVGHHRRYSRQELVQKLSDAGFEVERVHPYGVVVGHVLERVRNIVIERGAKDSGSVGTDGSGRLFQPRSLLGVVTWGIALPGRVLQRLLGDRAPGVGWVAVARRTD